MKTGEKKTVFRIQQWNLNDSSSGQQLEDTIPLPLLYCSSAQACPGSALQHTKQAEKSDSCLTCCNRCIMLSSQAIQIAKEVTNTQEFWGPACAILKQLKPKVGVRVIPLTVKQWGVGFRRRESIEHATSFISRLKYLEHTHHWDKF